MRSVSEILLGRPALPRFDCLVFTPSPEHWSELQANRTLTALPVGDPDVYESHNGDPDTASEYYLELDPDPATGQAQYTVVVYTDDMGWQVRYDTDYDIGLLNDFNFLDWRVRSVPIPSDLSLVPFTEHQY